MRITYRHEVRVPLSALVRSARRSSCSKATVLRTVGELALARSMAGVLRPLVTPKGECRARPMRVDSQALIKQEEEEQFVHAFL